MSGRIPEGWRECKLGDVAEIVGGGTPKTNVIEYWNGEIPWITPRDLSNFNGRFISKGERNISEKGLINSSARILPKGTILLSTRAPVGYLAIAENQMTTNQGFRSLIPFKNTDNIFLFYLLKNNVEYLKSQATGTTFGELSGSVLGSLIFPFPPLPEQHAIASVIGSLDDKIDLLNRENQTLEQMAEALFRQWFIEEADEQWEEVTLGDFFPVITGEKDANFATDDGSYPFFTCSKRTLWAPTYSFDGPAILLAGNGDFNIKHCVGKFEAYQRTYVLIPYDPVYFGFLLTLMKYYLSEITSGHQGSVIDFITKPMIKSFTFLLPKHRDSIQDNLVYLNELYKKIDINSSQILTLEKLRDTLLPKLMSGEVRVKL